MTMGGGFLTDDPWGDRQQDLPVPAFRQLVAEGLAPTIAPGERFEYSNLGYALLGLVIESVTGTAYPDVVRQRVLEPVGMGSSGYEVPDVGGAVVASGYVRRSSGWAHEEIAASGAFSPMGGLLSTVSDLARWVYVLQSVNDADQRESGDTPPISVSSLREMQVTQRLVAAVAGREPGAAPEVTGYGFGLFEDFRSWGRTVYHSGGYPGFGSHMRWHPATGLGIVALANGTYAPMSTVATAALQGLVEGLGAPRHAAPLELPSLQLARDVVTEWLESDDPEGEWGARLRELCADNVEQDVPWPERLVQWGELRRSHGRLAVVAGTESRPSPGSIRWLVEGTSHRGRVRVTVMAAPHDPTLLQSVELRAVDPAAPTPPAATDLS
jgi:CubicO group peptidase (beta-lactamase class C family)